MNDEWETICRSNLKSHINKEDAFGSLFLKHFPINADGPVQPIIYNQLKGQQRPIKQERHYYKWKKYEEQTL